MNRIVPLYSLLLAALLLLSCHSASEGIIPDTDPILNSDIAYIGRVSFADPQSPCFTYPGVQIRAAFEGTSIAMQMKPNSGYFMIEIDDMKPFKVNYGERDSVLLLAHNLPEGTHTITVTLAYEGYKRRPEFRGFILEPGRQLLPKPQLAPRKIEFIGNSITCGYGIEASKASDSFRDETENYWYTYAAVTARAFDAQSLVVARSGIGVYRNHSGPEQGSPDAMPAMYDQTLFGDRSEKWDFTQYTPDVVCINLGTNDTSLPGYDPLLLEEGFRSFFSTVRRNYPDAKIVLLTGSMLNGEALSDVKRVLDKLTNELKESGDRHVYRFDLSPQDGKLGYGAAYHPSLRQHYKNARELIPFIAEITGWNVINEETAKAY